MEQNVNKIVSKGVMYGFVRQNLQESADSENWNAWSIFVQSSQNQEMSDYVDRVTFILHESFSDNKRTVFNPPYETTILGLQECYAYIFIYFKDASVQPQFLQVKIEFTQNQAYQKGVKYDNLIFVRPNIEFYKKLSIIRPSVKQTSLLHHVQPDLFKALNPKARIVEPKANTKTEETKKLLEDCDNGDGVGIYIIEAVKRDEGAEKILEKLKL
ncbi:YEATS_family protein [Hexamita inflata]|uniref:YEATS family protein n=1 Tax=Hexamita inflata TaxID=28002 RepID=A0AA86P3I0_9EUKA|nr:YEATS family protein [Hexamita inflata]CAI9944663.1 YEATS family protein [Hexamita inflata]